MRTPQHGKLSFGSRAVVFVIPRREYAGDFCVDPIAGFKPFCPFAVPVGNVDQVARVKDKIRIGCVEHGGANGACPKREQVVLRVAKVDEGERVRLCRGRAKLIPRTPNFVATHAIGIAGIGLEALERDRVKMRGIARVHPLFRLCFFAPGPCDEIGGRIGFCDFAFGPCDARVRAPGNRCGGGRIARPVEDDAVGNLLGHGIDRGPVILIFMRASRGRDQKQKNETSNGHCVLL